MSITFCALVVFSSSIVGFTENTFSSKKHNTKKSKALKLNEWEVHEMIVFRLVCHSQFPEHNLRDFFMYVFFRTNRALEKKNTD